MARINVEDGLFIDQRWIELVLALGDADKALGALVRAWRVGQDYWKHSDNGIPKTVWNSQKINNAIIQVGLAHENGDFIKIHNSEKHFAWVRQKVEAGKNGGIASGDARREIIEENSKRNEAEASVANPLPLTLPLTHSLSLTQAQTQKNKTSKKPKSADADVCPFDLESVYQKYPRKEGKLPGMRSLAKQIKCQSDFDSFARAVENYASATAGRATEHIKMFSSFVGSERSDYPWREWVNYQPRQPMNKAEVQSSTNLNALKTYLSKKGIEV